MNKLPRILIMVLSVIFFLILTLALANWVFGMFYTPHDSPPLALESGNKKEVWKKYDGSFAKFYYPPDFIVKEESESTFKAKNSQYTLEYSFDASSKQYSEIIAEIIARFEEGDLSVLIGEESGHKVYYRSVMSAEGIFDRTAHIPYNTGAISISVYADTNLTGNEEPAIYKLVENMTSAVVSTIEFK